MHHHLMREKLYTYAWVGLDRQRLLLPRGFLQGLDDNPRRLRDLMNCRVYSVWWRKETGMSLQVNLSPFHLLEDKVLPRGPSPLGFV